MTFGHLHESKSEAIARAHQRSTLERIKVHPIVLAIQDTTDWLTALKETQKVMPESITVLTVADREAEIYDFLATERLENSQLLIRAYHNRQVKNSDGTLEVERLQNAIAATLTCFQR